MLKEKLGKELLLFDGGMGTQLQNAGLKAGEIPEEYNIDHPEIIVDVHKRYLRAGANFITTNTFGCNPLKMKESKYAFEDMILAAIENANKAKEEVNKEAYVVLDIGPIGTMLQPLGELSFDEAYEIIKKQVLLAKDKVDAVLLETMSDLYEVKAGILAVKENSNLPVFVSMTFDKNGRSLSGSDPITFVNAVEGLGVDVLGVNCSLGPKELKPIVDTILEVSSTPVLLQPNAGLPCLHCGKTHYEMTSEEFAQSMKEFMEKGIAIAGGCCGTTPEFISALKDLNIKSVTKRNVVKKTRVSSSTKTVTFDGQVVVCGERLNPTGKKKMKEALKAKQYEVCVSEAIRQKNAHADVLDVNVGVPGIDEVNAMVEVVKLVQEVVDLPLMIDSSNPEAIEKACRYYNGRPLINSINGKDEVMDAILPIAKKYGGVVVALTLEKGIPLLAEERFEIAKKMIEKANSYGVETHNIIIDCLTLTASAQQKEVAETLKALKMVKEAYGVHTVLGVSNVSFGLPNRPLLNRTFLTLAIANGLDLPIINPLDHAMMDCISAYNVLYNFDKESVYYIQTQSETSTIPSVNTNTSFTLEEIIKHGLKEEVSKKCEEVLEKMDAMEVINTIVIPALNKVGEDFEKNKIFLPQLIQSAETTKLAFDTIKMKFTSSSESKGPIMMCTVQGDVHDIGKNIVKVVMESYGYSVIDLGKDVKVEDVVKAYFEYQPKAIGLSALMATTVANMEKTIQALKEVGCTCPIWVGGAVLTSDIAKEIGADYYCEDAMASVNLLNKII